MFRKIIEELDNNRPVALVTIVAKIGSAPREPGTKMLVLHNGDTIGTIGGGVFERQVVSEALKALREGQPKKLKYVFRRDHIPEGAVPTGLECGGEVEVFIDIIQPKPRIIVVGAGHIGKPLADLANFMGFRVVVVDENKELASKERFPYAEKIIVDDLARGLEKTGIGGNDYVVIVYGGVEEDYKALRKALELKPEYIGLLGSKRKVILFKQRLESSGVNIEELKGRVYAPVGIDIGARTPEEIALSIMAEIVGLMKGARGLRHLSII